MRNSNRAYRELVEEIALFLRMVLAIRGTLPRWPLNVKIECVATTAITTENRQIATSSRNSWALNSHRAQQTRPDKASNQRPLPCNSQLPDIVHVYTCVGRTHNLHTPPNNDDGSHHTIDRSKQRSHTQITSRGEWGTASSPDASEYNKKWNRKTQRRSSSDPLAPSGSHPL